MSQLNTVNLLLRKDEQRPREAADNDCFGCLDFLDKRSECGARRACVRVSAALD
jgi:hypothetical protein